MHSSTSILRKINLSNEQQTSEVFGNFRGLDIPCAASNYPELSPVQALIIKPTIEKLRMHSNYDALPTNDEDFIKSHSTQVIAQFPQDATACLLQLFFPCAIGLVANPKKKHIINRYFTPQNIAKIFVAARSKSFNEANHAELTFEGFKVNKSILDILLALLPNQMVKKIKSIKNIENYKTTDTFRKKLHKLIKIARLVYRSYQETNDKNSMINGYPTRAIESILLTYMWEKNKASKIKLKPYYDEMCAAQYFDPKDVDKIIWAGNGSCYTKDDFQGDASKETSLEAEALLKLGTEYFIDQFPPAVHYGISKFKKDELDKTYSDCGDTVLRNIFMMFLYNNQLNKFDVAKLYALEKAGFCISKKLIRFFEEICPSPLEADSDRVRFEWSNVVSDLNNGTGKYKVKYLSPTPENGIYGIAAGLDNLLKVMGKLLGEPPEFDMEMKDKLACMKNVSKLCALFSEVKPQIHAEKNEFWTVSLIQAGNYMSEDICDLLEPVPETGWNDIQLIFYYGSNKNSRWPVFACDFIQIHFDLNKIYPHPLINKYDHTQIFQDLTPAAIYAENMNTSIERIAALDKMLWFNQASNEDAFKYPIKRWLEPTGIHFSGWQNWQVNSDVAKVLLKYWSVEKILRLNMPWLHSGLVFQLVKMRRLNEIERVLAADVEHFVNHFVRPDLTTFSSMARAFTQTLRSGDNDDLIIISIVGGNEYAKLVSGASLLHLAASSGNNRFSHSVDLLGIDPNTKTRDGMTPLHFAAKYYCSARVVDSLISHGADCNAETIDGKTPLQLCAEGYDKQEKNILLYGELEFIKSGDVVELFTRHLAPMLLLIEANADFTKPYKNNMTFQEWIMPKGINTITMAMWKKRNIIQADPDNTGPRKNYK